MTTIRTRCVLAVLLGLLVLSGRVHARLAGPEAQAAFVDLVSDTNEVVPLPKTDWLPARFQRIPFRYMTERRNLRIAKRCYDEPVEVETVWCFSNDDGTWTQRRPYSAFTAFARRAGTAEIIYDSATGVIRSVGSITSWGKQGRWFFRDSVGKRSTIRYRYGYHPDSLRNNSGQRLLVYYGYGFGGGGLCSKSEEQYAMTGATIGWCVVSPRMVVRAAIHNFPNDCIQKLRYGFGWKKQYLKDGCYIY